MRKKQHHTYMTLWHISHKSNIKSILESGVNPNLSTGKIKRSWFVRWYGLAWAFFHLSVIKRLPVWELVAFKVHIRSDRVTHFNRYVYTCVFVTQVDSYSTSDQILSAIERQWSYKRSYRPVALPARVENDLDWLGKD